MECTVTGGFYFAAGKFLFGLAMFFGFIAVIAVIVVISLCVGVKK